MFIVLSKMLLPSFFCGLVVSGIFAAAMSSSSSYLLISGSAVATNIFKGLIKRDATDNQVMIVARITLTLSLIHIFFSRRTSVVFLFMQSHLTSGR